MVTSHILFNEQAEPGLYLVSPRDPNESCTVEIFILHGLNGGPTKTWKHPETNCIWFRDLLPDQLKNHPWQSNARIWTYGYNASTSFNTENIYGHALTLLNNVTAVRRGYENRKIIWISHSLGGILVKTALNEAGNLDRYKGIRTATTGLIFLGTPHRGSGVANLGQVVATVAGAAVPGWQVFNRGLLKSLEKDNGMRIHSFYETRPLGPRVIVEQHSAVLSIVNEEVAHGLHANHKDMCKFNGPDDQKWIAVCNSILDLARVSYPRRVQREYNPYIDNQIHTASYPSHGHTTRVPVGGRNQTQPRNDGGTSYNRPNHTIPTPVRANPWSDPDYLSTDFYPPYPTDAPSTARSTVEAPLHIPFRPRPQQNVLHETNIPDSARAVPVRAQPTQNPNLSPDSRASTRRGPYPSVSPAYSREDLSMNRSTSQGHARTSSAPPLPEKLPSEQAQPSRQYSTQPEGRASDTNLHQEDVDSKASDMGIAACCDVCMNDIRCSQSRIQCTECHDYDLCTNCFSKGRVSKQHKNSHKVSHIISTQRLFPDDLTPPLEVVNPEYSPDKSKVNWSIVEGPKDPAANGGKEGVQCWRMSHLHGNDSHARFLTSATPGHFAITIYFETAISTLLTQEDRQELKEEGLGWLRVSFGTLRSNKEFFTGRYREDSFDHMFCAEESLPHKLLKEYWWDVVRIPLNESNMMHVMSDAVLSVEGHRDERKDLGLILQWSGVRCFKSGNEPLIKLTVHNIRIDDLLEYEEPIVRMPGPDTAPKAPSTPPVAVPADSPTPPEVSRTNASSTGNASNDVSVEDFLAALMQIQQEVQDAQQRAILEEALRLRAEQQAQERRDEILQALYVRGLLQTYASVLGRQY